MGRRREIESAEGRVSVCIILEEVDEKERSNKKGCIVIHEPIE